MHRLTASLSVIAIVLASGTSPVLAETVNCTPINAVPAVITVPGIYCFTKSLVTSMASGNAIEIQAHNVVIDMNGHRLGGLGAGVGTTARGIHATDRQNITIRNGTIRGFLLAILLDQVGSVSAGHLIEDIRADQNTAAGIWLESSRSIVRNNQVVATGGSTAIGANADVYGIGLDGDSNAAINNDVVGVVPIGTGESMGVFFGGPSGGGLAVNNRISETDYGVAYNPGTAGKYRDNLTTDVVTPYSGGTDAGNNN